MPCVNYKCDELPLLELAVKTAYFLLQDRLFARCRPFRKCPSSLNLLLIDEKFPSLS